MPDRLSEDRGSGCSREEELCVGEDGADPVPDEVKVLVHPQLLQTHKVILGRGGEEVGDRMDSGVAERGRQ